MSDPGTHYSLVMSGTEAMETRGVADADLPAPDVSIVITLFNEAASVDELYRRTIATLDSGPRTFELIFVDDGSTDGIISPQIHPDGDWADCGLPPIRGISTNVQGAPHRSANS